MVGGRVKIGESSEHAIKRELFEEMGKDGTTDMGKRKHWLHFDMIAKKK